MKKPPRLGDGSSVTAVTTKDTSIIPLNPPNFNTCICCFIRPYGKGGMAGDS